MSNVPNVYPEGVKILIEVDHVDRMTEGGIWLPDTSRESQQRRLTIGTIRRMGPDVVVRFSDDKELRVGSRIVFALYGGFNLKSDRKDNRDFRIINDEDVLALLEDDS